MKHAYLILAHSDWELLRTLISTLDDERNDIYVHIDAKVGSLPKLSTSRAGLEILPYRIDVRWGDVSVVEAEYALFRAAAAGGPYAYYHLLSGTDLPLKSQDEIHSFFDANSGKEFVGYTLTQMTPELVRKVCRWHLFPGSFRRKNILRSLFLRFQEILGIRRNRGIDFKKGTQWVSLTENGARVFLDGYPSMRRVFSHTFCADEIVVHTLIWHSPLRKNIYSLDSDGEGCKRAIGWRDGCLYDWSADDYDALAGSGALFARKFNLSDRAFIRRVVTLSLPAASTRHNIPALSVIMPVYNAAAMLDISLDSLRNQTFRDFEVVFIDDCSTDGSSAILEEFARTSGISCRIVRQVRNRGVAAARNLGLDAARGEYIAWLDADDALMPGALGMLYDYARPLDNGSPADIVGFDWRLGFEKNSRYMRQADWKSPLEALKALCGGIARWNLWLFLLRREFVESLGLRFAPGANMGEDMAFMLKAFASASKVVQIHEPLYRYNAVNSSSISRTLDERRRREIEANVLSAQSALEASEYAGELTPYFDYLKLYLKLPLLITDNRSSYMLWHTWMEEANPRAAANRSLPLRTRVLQWMAWKKLWAGVLLYYVFVYKFVYGIIYR